YHYQSFGVPGLGLKRGLSRDLVIAPYASALALPLEPAVVAANVRPLTEEGGEGAWGFYDALDYTPERVEPGKRNAIVACYMAHHHGMTLAALANALLQNRVGKRYQQHPLARSVELLLQERVPGSILTFQPH